MNSDTCKIYHVHGVDCRQHLEDYFGDKPKMVFGDDSIIFSIVNLTKTFTLGHIKGNILIYLSLSSMVPHLYAACEFFKHVIILKVQDRCILELKRWLDTRTGAFNWGHAAKLHADLQEKSDHIRDKDEKVKSAICHVVKCNFEKENMTEPIDLPPADCIISAWLLDVICKDKENYVRYLRKFSKLLKPGGHLILVGSLNATVGKDRLHMFTYDEDFARKALVGEGFTIDCCVIKRRTNVSDVIDYKAVIYIAAHK
ncbi:hypothetical protein GDO81_014022 [Engystomops pustulosus]|uniref:Nicotinamide N-methyltransferase n=2 Tax=Engystomops pustulosus TaxID=76066 RepID=A0AAV7B7V3_ENGPU|nr:hypothetical protein GDO81_014022 [Engystomops pustulosus]